MPMIPQWPGCLGFFWSWGLEITSEGTVLQGRHLPYRCWLYVRIYLAQDQGKGAAAQSPSGFPNYQRCIDIWGPPKLLEMC